MEERKPVLFDHVMRIEGIGNIVIDHVLTREGLGHIVMSVKINCRRGRPK